VLNGDIQPPTELVEGAIFQRTDASSWRELLALFKRGVQEFGTIDIVVPNAGVGDRGVSDFVMAESKLV
jgi:NAD(P)-dependent dehydrogenase (short-subunit alcohol dehydrogenase family)